MSARLIAIAPLEAAYARSIHLESLQNRLAASMKKDVPRLTPAS